MAYQHDYASAWNKVMHILRDEIGSTSFEIWFSMAKFTEARGNTIYISVPNTLTKEWIEARYLNTMLTHLRALTDQDASLEIITESQPRTEGSSSFLNSKYTFDTFVVGNSNRFAHAASLAVAQAPAKAYNPFFIYGGVGLGKTHLMHAIGHYILEQNPSCKVMYISSERFTNELINSIRDDKNVEFRNKYRTIDVLLIDDIQFIAGKERTQEEFFHTFNALHDANKQIVISSDRPPKEIPTLEERLRSRFEWGLITDIQPPDFETRIAILQKKAMMENLVVPSDVINFIATKIETNIRELEGALIRIVAYSSLTNSPIDLPLAEHVLKDILADEKPKQVTAQQIVEEVGTYFSIKPEDFKSKKRTKDLAFARQIAMYLCCELTDLSLPKIGDEFGGRDHTTVIHARDKIANDIDNDAQLSALIDNLKKKILYG